MIVWSKAATSRAVAHVATHMDHRIAMSFLVMGLASAEAGHGGRRLHDRDQLSGISKI